ncbi:hypothetical protein [Kitasatospora sp. NPDC051914]|uniref:hypothetical protein n=1 Tax=Kitasatospora sp. NPDC051914 TaxID=3154945 RepID=UPI003429F3C7
MSSNPAEHEIAGPDDLEQSVPAAPRPPGRRPAARRAAEDMYGGDDDLVGPSSTLYPAAFDIEDEPG